MFHHYYILCTLFCLTVAGGTQSSLISQDITICEHDTNYIKCPKNMIIRIISAAYGKSRNDNSCGDSTIVECYASSSLAKVFKKCDGKNQCKLRAHNRVFGDPCSYVKKNLKVSFACEKKQQVTTELDILY
ncbi:rhamnose-binding lectin-like [Aethina tumida]|uniref:rhamnose-binding lectin-like n=1 Tax=Aethina tumida TaxID=116153 RepID=UPI0021482B0C|nr:rhamnose-binding lectin-like [Aethina tumida]